MAIALFRSFIDPSPEAEFLGDVRLFKKAPKAPAAPDPAQTAASQTKSNKETAWYNAMLENMDQFTPYGNLTYQNLGTEEAPKWQSTIALSPEQQQLYNTQTQSENALASLGADQLGRIRDSVSTPFGYEGLGDAPTAQSVEQLSQQGQDAIMARLNPQFGYDEEALRTRLINQGIGQGSEAYRREMDTFNQGKNDARTQAILQGANYGGTLQNQALARRNQGIQEYTTQRNAPLNEYTAMTSGAQIQNPSFSSGGNQGIAPVDYAGLVNNQYQAQLGAYNSKVAGNNSLMGSLFSLGGTALGSAGGSAGWLAALPKLSDRRAKENIILVDRDKGFNIYQFTYKTDPDTIYEGVMADEVRHIMPEAVTTGDDGFDRVNYAMIGLEMREID
jgi:hypothetical protein